jgi:hypothetical protein
MTRNFQPFHEFSIKVEQVTYGYELIHKTPDLINATCASGQRVRGGGL